jgi:endo-1,4-beta-xylanase
MKANERILYYRLAGASLLFLLFVGLVRITPQKEVSESVLSAELTGIPEAEIVLPEVIIPNEEAPIAEAPGNLLTKRWEFMEGTKKTDEGILVYPTERRLVEQDGSFVQFNPPINLYGVHLDQIVGDFEIGITANRQSAKTATIQLYGRVPILADEFRIERESVKIDIEETVLKVSVWNGYKQSPALVQSFPVSNQSPSILRIRKIGETISFILNDQELGIISDSGVFASKQLWFGLDAKGSEWLLSDLTAHALEAGSLMATDSEMKVDRKNELSGLQALARKKRPDFLIGAAMALTPAVSDQEYASIAFDNTMFGSLTPENAMKMVNLQPQRGIYRYKEADALVKLAKENGLVVHGHTLVFGEANPSWFNELPVVTDADKSQIESIMRDHITEVITHFGSNVSSWDVINEPLDEDAEEGSVFRKHKWYQAMGEDYMINALETAYRTNPTALFFINEWGLEEDSERWNVFLKTMQKLKLQLNVHDIPVEKIGVGFQAHVYERGDRINAETLRKHIRQLESLGFKSQISEMDVYSDDGDEVQAKQYADIVRVCLEEKSCIRWNAWILSDRYNYWKDDDGSIQKGIDGLFDASIKPRPALLRIGDFLKI